LLLCSAALIEQRGRLTGVPQNMISQGSTCIPAHASAPYWQ
jgi:hypothetical protein